MSVPSEDPRIPIISASTSTKLSGDKVVKVSKVSYLAQRWTRHFLGERDQRKRLWSMAIFRWVESLQMFTAVCLCFFNEDLIFSWGLYRIAWWFYEILWDMYSYSIMPSYSDMSIIMWQAYLLERPKVFSNKTGDAPEVLCSIIQPVYVRMYHNYKCIVLQVKGI